MVQAPAASQYGLAFLTDFQVDAQSVFIPNHKNYPKTVYFTAYTIDAIDIQPSGKDALVKLKYDINMKGFDFKNNPETQKWIQENGNWYLQVPIDAAENLSK